jgi:hypothetical protein
LPAGTVLLHLAREVLTGELLPHLPQERRLDARLVAAAMAIAEREAEAGEGPAHALTVEIARLYELQPDGEAVPRDELFRRFASDLRAGAFEGSREGAARAILWRLTLWRLREANPKFLAANGFEA